MIRTNPALATLATLATLGLAATTAYAQATTDTAKFSSFVQNKVNGAGSGYVATTASKTTPPVYFTNDGNLTVEGINTLSTTGVPTPQFASYGLVDFATPYAFSAPVASISSVTFGVTEFSAGFTTASTNSVDIYLVTDSVTSDYYSTNSVNNSPLIYDTTATGTTSPAGLGSQLGAAFLLGTVSYSNGKPQLDSFLLNPNTAASTLLISQLNSGGNLRLALAQNPNNMSVAEGFDGVFYAPPTLTFNAFDINGNAVVGTPVAAPEPSSTVALLAGALTLAALAARRRVRPV